MGSKGEALASEFETANDELVKTLSGLSDEQWNKKCESETWPVGVTAHHIAASHQVVFGLVSLLASGGAMPAISPGMLDGMNAQHAADFANVGRDETIQVAKTSGAQVASQLRAIPDEGLSNTADMPTMGGKVSAEQMAQSILIGHVKVHLESIKGATGAS